MKNKCRSERLRFHRGIYGIAVFLLTVHSCDHTGLPFGNHPAMMIDRQYAESVGEKTGFWIIANTGEMRK